MISRLSDPFFDPFFDRALRPGLSIPTLDPASRP
jgi:hypothetical protein